MLADTWVPCHPVSTWIGDGDTKSEAVAEAVILISVFPTGGGGGAVSLVGNSVLKEEMACVTIRLNRETLMLSSIEKEAVCLGRRSSDGMSNQTGYISHQVETCLELQLTLCDR